jgi:hypothetical protein
MGILGGIGRLLCVRIELLDLARGFQHDLVGELVGISGTFL